MFLQLVALFFKKYLFSSRAGSVVKRISWLTIAALTVSTSSLIVVMSVMGALNNGIQQKTLAVEPHMRVEIPEVQESRLLSNHPVYAKLKMNPDLQVFVTENQDVILRTMDGRFQGAIARGLTEEAWSYMVGQIRKANKFSKEYSMTDTLEPGQIVMGSDLAITLGVFEGDSVVVVPPETLLLPVGQSPQYDKAEIQKLVSSSIADVDAKNIFYLRDQSLKRLKTSSSRKLTIEVWSKDPFSIENVQDSLKSFSGLKIELWKERNAAMFMALRIERFVITLFLGLAATLASFSMISVLVLLISQKKREIGILQAMGLSRVHVRQLFLLMGVMLSMAGVVAGLVVGSGLSLFLQFYPLNVLPDIYYDAQISALWEPGFAFGIFIIGAFVAIAGSFISAKTASQLEPAQALRAKY